MQSTDDSSDQKSDQNSDPKAPRRKVSNLLIRPKQQIRFVLYVFGVAVTFLTVFITMFLYTLSETIAGFGKVYNLDEEIVESLRMSLSSATIFTIAFACLLVISMFAAGIAFTHRFYGPLVPLLRLIGELKIGNYSARGALREKDEMHEVMDGLNELAATLEARAEQNLKNTQ